MPSYTLAISGLTPGGTSKVRADRTNSRHRIRLSIKNWCDVQQKTYVKFIEPLLPDIRTWMDPYEEEERELYLWPDDAFQTPAEEMQDVGAAAENEQHTEYVVT